MNAYEVQVELGKTKRQIEENQNRYSVWCQCVRNMTKFEMLESCRQHSVQINGKPANGRFSEGSLQTALIEHCYDREFQLSTLHRRLLDLEEQLEAQLKQEETTPKCSPVKYEDCQAICDCPNCKADQASMKNLPTDDEPFPPFPEGEQEIPYVIATYEDGTCIEGHLTEITLLGVIQGETRRVVVLRDVVLDILSASPLLAAYPFEPGDVVIFLDYGKDEMQGRFMRRANEAGIIVTIGNTEIAVLYSTIQRIRRIAFEEEWVIWDMMNDPPCLIWGPSADLQAAQEVAQPTSQILLKGSAAERALRRAYTQHCKQRIQGHSIYERLKAGESVPVMTDAGLHFVLRPERWEGIILGVSVVQDGMVVPGYQGKILDPDMLHDWCQTLQLSPDVIVCHTFPAVSTSYYSHRACWDARETRADDEYPSTQLSRQPMQISMGELRLCSVAEVGIGATCMECSKTLHKAEEILKVLDLKRYYRQRKESVPNGS